MSSQSLQVGRVSVVIPTFNRAAMLKQCIDSLLPMKSELLEIIVVDDGSSDETPSAARSYGEEIRYIRKENGGKARAVNLGVASSKGDWIWIIDDDDLALPGSISERLAALDRAPDAGFVYAAHEVTQLDEAGSTVSRRRYVPPEVASAGLALALMKDCFFHLGSCLVSRRLFLSLGGLDPTLRTGEDYDFQIRMARQAQAVYCPALAFEFRQHPGPRAAGAAIRAAEREAKLRQDTQIIGRRLRRQVDLHEFDPDWGPTVSREDRAHLLRAHVHRLVVMCGQGCIPEALEDLDAVTYLSAGPMGQSAWQACGGAEHLKRAICTAWAWSAWMAQESESKKRFRLTVAVAVEAGSREPVLRFLQGFWLLARGHPGSIDSRLKRLAYGLRYALLAIRLALPAKSDSTLNRIH